ncbi:glycosyltransferase 87 family protein [Psychroserpens algicola]|uniref:Glycosyltransferase 87 family protein n=1 Tax=Psychroserpens algicola TaxID=1719034 RepID=A0ABT0H4U9_9FLAO|nr:glycosyltransferase 87 family protein [Psychroserpens algicola]MCK8479405.1 glycosyltransferase 87 family protein [Psychroserpens algicola]
MQFWKLYKVPLLLTCVSFFLYGLFAYDLVRTDYTKLIVLYSLLWVVFLSLLKYAKNNIKFLSIVAFISRAIFILAIPNLSQDFYRFIWDGRMILEGLNPYLYLPQSFIEAGGELPVAEAEALYAGMGELNGSHYTNYPPINQLCFVIAGLFSGHKILGAAIVLRLLIIAADFGTLVFGKRLLKHLNLSEKNIFWYILNPFIIIELTGNLHFEAVMIFFLVWSLYLLHIGKWKWAAVVFSLSISVKLIPLLFLPLFLFWFKKTSNTRSIDFKKLLSFYIIVGSVTLVLFAPFFSLEFVNNYAQTVGLWFQNFEFNASIYYVAREIGYLFRGYNEIAVIGKILAVLVFLTVIGLAFFRRKTETQHLIITMLFAFTIYLFLSTTVHPWYIATLLILSVFTNYKFPLVWSFVIILSYLAYIHLNKADKSENLWIIALEYIVVYSVFIWEVFIKKPTQKELAPS